MRNDSECTFCIVIEKSYKILGEGKAMNGDAQEAQTPITPPETTPRKSVRSSSSGHSSLSSHNVSLLVFSIPLQNLWWMSVESKSSLYKINEVMDNLEEQIWFSQGALMWCMSYTERYFHFYACLESDSHYQSWLNFQVPSQAASSHTLTISTDILQKVTEYWRRYYDALFW